VFIRDYQVKLARAADRIEASVLVDAQQPTEVTLEIPALKIRLAARTDAQGRATFSAPARGLERWSPENPRLYDVKLSAGDDAIRDRVGFRRIEVRGTDILLNGKPVFLRGISLHEENPLRGGRAYSMEDARLLLGWAKELGCNFVRLAHYPHNENMARVADEMGLMLWEEVPVYWTIAWQNPDTLAAYRRGDFARAVTPALNVAQAAR
jgi:beta-glucuronidase